MEFYPSISEKLLTSAIELTRVKCCIGDSDVNYKEAQRSILFHDGVYGWTETEYVMWLLGPYDAARYVSLWESTCYGDGDIILNYTTWSNGLMTLHKKGPKEVYRMKKN